MAGFCRLAVRPTSSSAFTNLADGTLSQWTVSLRTKFTKSRIPKEVFEERAKEHEKYGGDPEQPHMLHLVTRVKSTKRRPYWEKKIVEDFGLLKAHQPYVHKNIPSVNNKLKIIKHLVKIQPLKLPHGLPEEEDVTNTFLKSTGELVVRQRLNPLEPKDIES
ncbi:39S ribosomal protein L30, mitochondrial-like [Scleropages formosus]|uniref:Large ribosomal subunit protein uL30m n=1 Tax=Scleropages formosus TaxID=113540 RepID=A0A0P7UPR9_SCLFO|nr:39S ribosomal protein L30, mitochondrial [Scleropages formosus]KPP71104.1 39S ribosomal protein L30, mitochondrial-like [Scleropages formosus]